MEGSWATFILPFVILRIEARVSHALDKFSTTELQPQISLDFLRQVLTKLLG